MKYPSSSIVWILLASLGASACSDPSLDPRGLVEPDRTTTADGEPVSGLPTAPRQLRDNGVMLQYFHWYLPNDGQHWTKLAQEANALAEAGFTSVWLPPASKASGGSESVGYGVYDLYDLGEFNQKGSVRTKYGTKAELQAAVDAAQRAGLDVYADIVLNHRIGADRTESVQAIPVNPTQRLQDAGPERTIQAWTLFDFPGRGGRYSDFVWSYRHFNGVDWDQNVREQGRIYRFAGKSWDPGVSEELGNYDYLLGSDVDMESPEVVAELKTWGAWYRDTLQLDGFRLDAVKHIHRPFTKAWLRSVRQGTSKELFTVAEYWDGNVEQLVRYIEDESEPGEQFSLFDVALHFRMFEASRAQGNFDLSLILNNTLVQRKPSRAVSFVDNHDTQPLQSLESPVADWFKPLAYALILLRAEAYPAVFYADYYGATYQGRRRDGQELSIVLPSFKPWIDLLIKARQQYGFGEQRSYFDDPDIVGWTRRGTAQHPSGMAVLMSDKGAGTKRMMVGPEHAGRCFTDLTAQQGGCVVIDRMGEGLFPVGAAQVSIYVGPDGNDRR